MTAAWQVLALARPVAGRLGLGILAGAAALGCAVGLAGTAAWLVSRAAEQPPILYLSVAVVGVRAFGLGRGLLRYAERLLTHDAALRVLADLRVRVYTALERLAPAGLPAFRRGDLLARLVDDVDDVQNLLLRGVAPPVTALLVGAAAVVLATALLPAAGLVLAAGLTVGGTALPWLARTISARAERRTVTVRAALATAVVSTLAGAADLVAYGAQQRALDEVTELDALLRRAVRRSALTAAVVTGLGAASSGATAVATLLVAVPAVRSGDLPGVQLAVLVLLAVASFEAVDALPAAAQQRQRSGRAAARVLALDDAAPQVVEPAQPAELPSAAYEVELRGVRARWPGADELALDGVDLALPAGRRAAIVGPSGAGKSTIAAVLLRFLDVAAGRVVVNGVSTSALDGDRVRQVIGLCAQDAHLFDSTIAANLRLARPGASDAELLAAARAAKLDAWLSQLPDGLETLVGELGCRVSGGQRQRIALARALLADFPVLVLDEPAANLDTATADALTADLLAATRGRTTVLITHRLAGLDAVEEIMVLDAGRVVERGTHAELHAAGGLYEQLWRREQAHVARPVRVGARAI